MKPIPFKIRILYYLAFVPIFIVLFILLIILIYLMSDAQYSDTKVWIATIFGVLFTHYVFGTFFLKTKLIIKLLVPFLVAFASNIVIYYFLSIILRNGFIENIIQFILMFFIFAVMWEIAYQILKRKTKEE